MDKLLAAVLTSVLPKLLEKYLTPNTIEKYSDKLLDIARKNVKKLKNDDMEDLLLQVISIIDDAIGEK